MAKRALVIRSGYDSLPGVHNSAACITRLLEGRGFEIIPCLGDQATRRGILRAYDALTRQTQRGDAAVVYYTGHGGLVVNTQHARGLPRYVQHICPSDFAETTEDDFRGIGAFELALQLAALTRKTDNVTVLLECCFSAELSRVAGVQDAPITPPTLTRTGLTRYLATMRARARREGPPVVTGNPLAVRVAASGQTELARWVGVPPDAALQTQGLAFRRHDDWIGAMTLGLSQILAGLGEAHVPWRAIAPALRARLLVQRPEIEGPISRVPFSTTTVDATTLPVHLDGDGAVVDAGRIVGVSAGDVYAVVPPGRSVRDPSAVVASFTIDEVSATQGCAHRIRWKTEQRMLPEGAVAVALSRALERHAIRVVAPAPQQAVIIAGALQAAPQLRVATADDREVLAAVCVEDDLVTLRDAIGALSAAVAFPGGLPDVVRRADQLATVRRLRALADDGGLALTGVAVELGIVEDGELRRIADHGASLGVGDAVAVRLANHTGQTLFASVFNIGVAGRIALLSPGASGVELAPAAELVVGEASDGTLTGLRLSWPADLPTDHPRVDTILVIITATAADLQSLGITDGTTSARTREERAPDFALHWRDYLLFPGRAALEPRTAMWSGPASDGPPARDLALPRT